MSISPISSVLSGSTGISSVLSALPTSGTSSSSATASVNDGGFGDLLTNSVDSLQQMQSTSKDLALKAVTGDLSDVHDYTIAATQSAVAMELTAAVRNRAVDAFNEIMRMQA